MDFAERAPARISRMPTGTGMPGTRRELSVIRVLLVSHKCDYCWPEPSDETAGLFILDA